MNDDMKQINLTYDRDMAVSLYYTVVEQLCYTELDDTDKNNLRTLANSLKAQFDKLGVSV